MGSRNTSLDMLLHRSKGGGRNVGTHFPSQMCAQYDDNGEFLIEDTKRAFPSLRIMCLDDDEAHRLPRNAYAYCEYRYALSALSRVKTGLLIFSHLMRKALFRILVWRNSTSYGLGIR